MTTKRKHVAVCAFPFASHATALLLLSRRVAAAAPDVHFTFFNTQASNSKLFKPSDDDPPVNIKPYGVKDGIPDGHVFSSPDSLLESIGLYMKNGPENVRKSMIEAEEEVGIKIGCVMSDSFIWFSGKIAEERGVDWVPLWTGGPMPLSSHVHTQDFRSIIGLDGIEGRETETVGFVPGFSQVRLSDLPEGIISGNLNSPISQLLDNVGQNLPKATAVAVNCFEELEPAVTESLKSKFKKLLCIGPFPLTLPDQLKAEDPYDCLPWLDTQKPASAAYISFGTVSTPPTHELSALSNALESKNIPFLWSITHDAMKQLPSGFVDRTTGNGRGKFVTWAPQMRVLAHSSIGVFVTHCGWKSTIESIVTGVPLVCRPFFADQMLNRRFVESVWRIGTGVEGGELSQNGTAAAFEMLLESDEGKRMRQRLIKLKELAQIAAAEPDGSSIKNFNTLIDIVAE